MDGGSQKRLLWRQAEEGAGHVHRQGQRGHRRGPWVEVGRHRHRHTGRAQGCDRGGLPFAQRVEGTRQDHGNGPCVGHGSDAVGRKVLQVIRRKRSVAGRKGRTALVGQLFGVQLHRKAKRARFSEKGREVVGGKGDRLAEGIHGVDQPLGVGSAQGWDRDLSDVSLCAAFVVRRNGMGGKVGGLHRHRARLPDPPRHPQHLQLVRDCQPIAGFHFDRRHTAGNQLVNPGQGPRQKLILIRFPRGGDGGQDAAARTGDLLVGRALQPQLELHRPMAREDGVGMTVDQARSDKTAPCVMFGKRPIGNGQICHRPDPGNLLPVHRHGGVRDQAISIGHRRKGGVGHEHRLAL